MNLPIANFNSMNIGIYLCKIYFNLYEHLMDNFDIHQLDIFGYSCDFTTKNPIQKSR